MRRHIDRLFRHQRLTKMARRHPTSRSSASPAARRVAGTSCWPALRRSPAGVAKVQQLGGDRHTQLQADPQQRLFLSGGRLRVERHRHGNRQIVLGIVAVFAATEKSRLAALPARKARACARLKRRNRTPGSAFGVLLDVTDDASIDARRLRPRRHSRGIAAGGAAPPVRRQTVRRGGADRGRATGMRQRRSERIIITSMGLAQHRLLLPQQVRPGGHSRDAGQRRQALCLDVTTVAPGSLRTDWGGRPMRRNERSIADHDASRSARPARARAAGRTAIRARRPRCCCNWSPWSRRPRTCCSARMPCNGSRPSWSPCRTRSPGTRAEPLDRLLSA